jgi:hypothetical protein
MRNELASVSMPESLESFDPRILGQVASVVGSRPRMLALHKQTEIDNVNPDFLELVSPITERFTQFVLDTVGFEPPQIYFRPITQIVYPDQAHLVSRWHRDNFPYPEQLAVIASALPPEFAIWRDNLLLTTLERDRYIAHLENSTSADIEIEEGIDRGWLGIHQPQIHELIVTNGFHRSAKNNTGVPIKRNYLALMTGFNIN